MNKIISSTRSYWIALGLILLFALGLRVWGIRFGLPYIYHVDEHFYVATALKLGDGVLNNSPYAPTGFSNILFGNFAIYYLIGKALHLFDSAQAFEVAYRSEPTTIYTIARLVSAFLGAAAVLCLYVLGRVTSRAVTGLLAALILSVSFLHVRDSHFAVPDIAMSTFVILTVVLSATAIHSSRRIFLYLAAIAGGMAVSMKWTGLPIFLVVWWATVCFDDAPRRGFIGKLINKQTISTGIFFLVGFIFSSPQIIINPDPYIRFSRFHASLREGFGPWLIDSVPGWIFYGKTLWYGATPIILMLGLGGFIRRLMMVVKIRDKYSILLLLFPVTYYLYMGATRLYFARYTLPLIPFVVLFATEFVVEAVIYMTKMQIVVRYAVILLLALMTVSAFFLSIRDSIRNNTLLTREDTRSLAKNWMEGSIPEGSKIANEIEPHGPPLSRSIDPMHPFPFAKREFDVHIMNKTGLSDKSLDWYYEQGFDYLVASGSVYKLTLINQAKDADRKAFYRSLDNELEVIQTFYPRDRSSEEPQFIFNEIYGPVISLWDRDRPGPTIKIYKLTDEYQS